MVRVLSLLLIGNSPHQTERVTGRVSVNPEQVVLLGIGHSGRTERQDLALSGVDVVDGDVEVELLRTVRIGKTRRIVLRGQLKGEPTAYGSVRTTQESSSSWRLPPITAA